MLCYAIRRLAVSVPVLILSSLVIFCAISAAGDPLAQLKQDPRISDSTIQSIADDKRLEDPLLIRYLAWAKSVAADGFGTPLLSPDQSIWSDLGRVIPNTLQVAITAELIALLIGGVVGMYGATRRYSLLDHMTTTLSFIAFATPTFVVALGLQTIFVELYRSTGLRIVYTSGLSTPGVDAGIHHIVDRIQHLALPVIALSVVGVAQYGRYMRSAMLEELGANYVRTAYAKGLDEDGVVVGHVLRNAIRPVVTQAGLNFGVLIGGSIIVESIFQIDGMGAYLIQALLQQDVYPVMAVLLVIAATVVVFNLIADLIYVRLDPRISRRHVHSGG